MVPAITSNGAADVPYISHKQRRRRRTIGFVKILNAAGVLQYVLLKARSMKKVEILFFTLLGDLRFEKKNLLKKPLDQRKPQFLETPINYRPVVDESVILENNYYQKNAQNILLMDKAAKQDYDILFPEN